VGVCEVMSDFVPSRLASRQSAIGQCQTQPSSIDAGVIGDGSTRRPVRREFLIKQPPEGSQGNFDSQHW
jgi:hypothetical protein